MPSVSNLWFFFFNKPFFFSSSAAFLFISISRPKLNTRFDNENPFERLSSISESVPSSLQRFPCAFASSLSLDSSLLSSLPLFDGFAANFCVSPVNRDGFMTDSPREIRIALGKHSFLMIGTIGANVGMGSFLTMCASSLVSRPKLKETFFFLTGFFG